MWDASFAPVPPGRQLGAAGLVKMTALRLTTLPARAERLPTGSKSTGRHIFNKNEH
jgi:hypothetical protein